MLVLPCSFGIIKAVTTTQVRASLVMVCIEGLHLTKVMCIGPMYRYH